MTNPFFERPTMSVGQALATAIDVLDLNTAEFQGRKALPEWAAQQRQAAAVLRQMHREQSPCSLVATAFFPPKRRPKGS